MHQRGFTPSRRQAGRATVAGVLAAALLAPSAAAAARTRVVARIPQVATTREHVPVSGRVAARSAQVVLEQRIGSSWRARARGTAARAFRLRWRAPARPGVAKLRVVARHRGRTVATSRVARVAVGAVAVLSPRSVLAAPPGGEAGTLRYFGRLVVHAGEFVALAAGPASPEGLLARVVAIRSEDGETVLDTVPASLPEALPEGHLRLRARALGHERRRVEAAAAPRRFSSPLSCNAQVEAALDGSLAVGLAPALSLAWAHGTITSAEARATFSGNADLGVRVGAGGVCSLAQTAVASWNAPPLEALLGPIPVVVIPRITLYVAGEARATTSAETRLTGAMTATAGLRFDGATHPIGSFRQSFEATPPAPRSDAAIGARVIPSVELLLYGQVGPRFDLSTGLQLDADASDDPSWSVTAPVELSAGLRVPGLELPQRTVLSRSFPVAEGHGGGGGVPPAGESGQAPERARIRWNTDADVDLHVWDASGRHTWFRESGIPGVLLSRDDTDGFGPESLDEEPGTGRSFSYGLCFFDDNGGAGATDVALRLTESDGTVRESARTLRGPGDAAVIESGPGAFVPPAGWCEPRR